MKPRDFPSLSWVNSVQMFMISTVMYSMRLHTTQQIQAKGDKTNGRLNKENMLDNITRNKALENMCSILTLLRKASKTKFTKESVAEEGKEKVFIYNSS